MKFRSNGLFPKRSLAEEFEQGCAIAQVTLNGADVALQECSTYDLMCLAANMKTALTELLNQIAKTTGNTSSEVLRTVATIRSANVRIRALKKIRYVDLGVRRV